MAIDLDKCCECCSNTIVDRKDSTRHTWNDIAWLGRKKARKIEEVGAKPMSQNELDKSGSKQQETKKEQIKTEKPFSPK